MQFVSMDSGVNVLIPVTERRDGTFFDAKKELKRTVGFVAGGKGNVLKLASRVGYLIESVVVW